MGFLSRLLVLIGLSFGLTLLLMVAMYEPEAPPLTASESVTAASTQERLLPEWPAVFDRSARIRIIRATTKQ